LAITSVNILSEDPKGRTYAKNLALTCKPAANAARYERDKVEDVNKMVKN
jgi:hypothetical protein